MSQLSWSRVWNTQTTQVQVFVKANLGFGCFLLLNNNKIKCHPVPARLIQFFNVEMRALGPDSLQLVDLGPLLDIGLFFICRKLIMELFQHQIVFYCFFSTTGREFPQAFSIVRQRSTLKPLSLRGTRKLVSPGFECGWLSS